MCGGVGHGFARKRICLVDFNALGTRLKLSLAQFVLELLSFASAGGKTMMSKMQYRVIFTKIMRLNAVKMNYEIVIYKNEL